MPYALSGRLRDSSVGYFFGNASGYNSAEEAAAEAKFGLVGIGWQINNVLSNDSHLEAAEIKTASQLKILRPGVRVLASRNTEVVSIFWDSVRAAFADISKDSYWVKDVHGRIVQTAWVSPAGNTPKRWVNFTNRDAASWWAKDYIGPILAGDKLDGIYFDCACEDPPGVEPVAFESVKASAQLAVDNLLPQMAAAGKWVSAWDWDGRLRRSSCATDVRSLLARASNYSTLQVLYDFRDTEQTLETSAAALLLARGPHATLMWPVTGIYEKASDFPWNATLLDHDFGQALDEAMEDPPGVFVRHYSNGDVSLDCKEGFARFVLR